MQIYKSGFAVALTLLVSAFFESALMAQMKFNLKCHPFQSLELAHPIDTSCPSAAGNATPVASGHALQNIAKNNFCAKGQVVDIMHSDLLQLQNAIETNADYKTWNDKNLPADRTPFISMSGNLKEGMLVRYTGFIYELHAADVTGGESVNCNQDGPEANDIHIAFVADPANPECTSVTAEMSPHFRPKAWVAGNMAPKLALFLEPEPGKWKANAAAGKRLSRVTGQLMFDAAHKPCVNGQPIKGDPLRISDWEVHPVYKMEVCKTAGPTCADPDWQPLDQFLGASSTATSDGGPTKIPHKKKTAKSSNSAP